MRIFSEHTSDVLFLFRHSFRHEDEEPHQARVRRPSIVIREHQLSQYPINYDPSPEIIRRKATDHHAPIVYKQQIAVRYLCPPTPPPPAPLIIREVRQPALAPLPPSKNNTNEPSHTERRL